MHTKTKRGEIIAYTHIKMTDYKLSPFSLSRNWIGLYFTFKLISFEPYDIQLSHFSKELSHFNRIARQLK